VGINKRVFAALQKRGWRGLLVGGAVRDMVMGMEPKDMDIEAYGASPDELHAFLLWIADGDVDAVGRSFGVFKCRIDGEDYDFSIPRRENKTGVGHVGFVAEFDPAITPSEAAMRRDFTMNAMAYDPLDDSLFDHFGGREDLENRVLRHTSVHFAEDALRVLRGMQFCGRFDLDPAPETVDVAARIPYEERDALSLDRIWGEWKKWAEKSVKPSKGLRFLRTCGWLPDQLAMTVPIPQDPEWHPEGGVWRHSLEAVDVAVQIADADGLEGDDRVALVLAALCHDIGKITTTVVIGENVTSLGHDQAGADIATAFLKGIGAPEHVVERVIPLVREHMAHLTPATPRTVRRLADRLSPCTILDWARIVTVDHSARPPLPGGMPAEAREYLRLAQEMEVDRSKPKPILMGRHLIAHGMTPSIKFGNILQAAYEAQLDGDFADLEGAVEWLRNISQ
jgi:tRNA nucleotidyltransferase (CCA-adding enzyme)